MTSARIWLARHPKRDDLHRIARDSAFGAVLSLVGLLVVLAFLLGLI